MGAALTPGTTVLFSGDLGAGKTVLVRGIGEVLGASRVRSPSFTLVNEYPARECAVIHADLYRLSPDGVAELGLEDYLDEDGHTKCLLLVEWAERWVQPPEEDVLRIAIKMENETERVFLFSSRGEKADAALGVLCEKCGPAESPL